MARSMLLLMGVALLLGAALSSNVTTHDGEEPTHFKILKNQWSHIHTPYTIAVWLLIASGARIVFVLLHPVTRFLPDSSLLLVVGLALGGLLKYGGTSTEIYNLSSHAFFIYLLPPIIFDAGYFMPNRALFENLDSVLLFAVVGTIFNCIAIGGSLFLASSFGVFTMEFSLIDIFMFSSLISAVDPVAVITVFEEINVNAFLFVNVFGEALFNDGVSVVLYNLFTSFHSIGAENLLVNDYVSGGLSFFVIALGGILIGIIFAFICSFITKYTEDLKAMATVFVFIIPYLAYLTAEWWGVSSILAITSCGMVMKQYVKGNLSQAANSSVKYATKIMAQSSETVIFMFIGLSFLSSGFYWDTWFVVCTIVFCLVYRTIGVIAQCYILNRFRKQQFTAVDQFILCYGGLRGAIAYGVAASMPDIPAKDMFVTTTIAVIYFTVFLQGSTIKPLVKFFNIKTEDHRIPTMTESVYNKYLDYAMSGVEDIIGHKGHYSFNEIYERFNAKVFKPIFMRNQQKSDFDATKILRAYAKLTLEEAMNMSAEKSIMYPDKRLENLKREEAPRASARVEPMPQPKISQIHMEELYKMFSSLLDQKLQELQVNSQHATIEHHGDDIEDDYLLHLNHSNKGSRMDLATSFSGNDLSRSLRAAQSARRRSAGNILNP